MQRIRRVILALAALAALLPGGPAFAQAETNETVFIQGTERHPARILPGRFALVLSDGIVTDADRYREALDSLKGKPVSKLPRNIIAIEAPDLRDAKSLNASARDMMTSRPEVVVDSGIFVTIGESDLPFVLTDKIVVQIAKGKEPDLIQQVAKEFSAEVVGGNPFDKHQFVVRLLPSNTRHALEVSNAINGYPGISFAHPNFYRPVDVRQTAVIPNDTFFGSQWHLNNTGQGLGTADADIDADLAWSFGLGSSNIIIAVIDDAFEINHPDLTGGLWTNGGETPANGMDDDGNGLIDDVNGWDFTACIASVPCGDNNLSPSFGDKHGTPAAGAALARGNNNLGVSGTCPQCTFLPIAGLNGPVFAQGLAFGYAQAMGAHIISNSWGYPIGTISTANVVTALNNAATAGRGGLGTVVLFAMNNSVVNDCTGPTPDISSLPNVIAVSRATNQDRFSPGGFGDCMDVLGPTHGGTLDAVTTDRQGTNGYNDVSPPITCTSVEPAPPPSANRDYTFCFGGTSFATPVAAGVAGLVLSLDNSLTRQQVQRLLQDTADKISDSAGAYSGETGFSAPASSAAPTHGYGRVNAFEAVRTVAPRMAGGREGADVFLRDNRLDWGNTEQPSNVTFEQMRGFIPHWQSVDIKVDAPPYLATPPATSVNFEAFVHENPVSNTLNRVYVRVHNRGTRSAADVRVKLHWAFAGAGLPALPADFWTVFPSDSTDLSVWHPLPMQTIVSLPYSGASVAGSSGDGSAVLSFDFAAPIYNPTLPHPDHYCLFAVVDAADDPVSTTATGSQVPDFITPRDNNVTHRNVQLLNSGRSDHLDARIVLSNPFDYLIETRLVAWLPKNWKFATDSAESGGKIELAPGKSLPVEIAILPGDDTAELIDVVQLYRAAEMEKEEVLGGTTYDVAPRKDPSRPLLESSDLLELISQHQTLVADYQKLVSQTLSKRDSSTDDRSLLERMGKLLEGQSRLLWEMERSRSF
ncbi:S8 family serine peptidase [Pseudaminobacter sp. NGMCC 1.201702]|uniref:S8 family serine peptidase n=1 Tax=Pseudaminobacter sp. NGMCC 1.201702 TaxID=3391825 RepID=UPI0039EECC5F